MIVRKRARARRELDRLSTAALCAVTRWRKTLVDREILVLVAAAIARLNHRGDEVGVALLHGAVSARAIAPVSGKPLCGAAR